MQSSQNLDQEWIYFWKSYYSEQLGLRFVTIPESLLHETETLNHAEKRNESASLSNSNEAIIVVHVYKNYDLESLHIKEHQRMFDRLLEAIRIKKTDIQIFEIQEEELDKVIYSMKNDSRRVLIFVTDPELLRQRLSGDRIGVLHSLFSMSQNAELKKDTWSILKGFFNLK